MSSIDNDEKFAASFKEPIASDYKDALSLMNVSPDISLFKFRKILEKLCLLYSQYCSYPFVNESLCERINELADIGAIHGADRKLFHDIRSTTNDGVHVKKLSSESLVKMAKDSREKLLNLLESAYIYLRLGERLPKYDLVNVGGQELKDLWFECLNSSDYKKHLKIGSFYEELGRAFENEVLDDEPRDARSRTMFFYAAESYKSAFQICANKSITEVIGSNGKQMKIAQESYEALFKYALLSLNDTDTLHIDGVTKILDALARRGYHAAYSYLGWCNYLSGNYKKAHKYLTHKKAEKTAFLFKSLGTLYSCDRAGSLSSVKAIESFKKAASLGCHKSKFELGRLYHQGVLVEKNDEVAQEYLAGAIIAGNLEAASYFDESYLKIRELFSVLIKNTFDKKINTERQKPYIKTTQLGRNEKCLCGSNSKYKYCCGN